MYKILNKNNFVLFFFLLLTTQSFSKVNIAIKINNEILTNYDILKESAYLKILNPNLNNLDESQIYELAKNSLINEVIKKNEIKKKFNINAENSMISEIFFNLIERLNVQDEKIFEKLLEEKKSYSVKEIKDKLKIELFWNDLIFANYKKQISVDENKLLKKIDAQINLIKYRYFLSEIVFTKNREQKLEDLISQINESIIQNGFNNTANIFSISESSKFGGKIGWIDEDSLSSAISSKLKELEIGQFTDIFKIDNNYIVLKIEDKKLKENNLDREEELKKLIKFERNRQLNQFSNIYFRKVKMNYELNE